jgi:hypothetical protein
MYELLTGAVVYPTFSQFKCHTLSKATKSNPQRPAFSWWTVASAEPQGDGDPGPELVL